MKEVKLDIIGKGGTCILGRKAMVKIRACLEVDRIFRFRYDIQNVEIKLNFTLLFFTPKNFRIKLSYLISRFIKLCFVVVYQFVETVEFRV